MDRRRARGLVAALIAFVLASIASAGLLEQQALAASEAVSLSQCTNGAVGPPVVPEPCVNGTLGGTSFSNWVNGNANASKSHWSEGQFISYRADLTGLGKGSHTYTIDYHVVDTGTHAIDYLGSYDATETTSPTGTADNRDDNNPCFDILGSGTGSGCTALGTPPTPAATTPVPTANLAGEKTCNGAAGLSTTPTQIPGTFDLFAPTAAGATMTAAGASYVTQNVTQGGGVCDTTIAITFNLSGNAPTGGWEVVLAWGGHIASVLDWGDGNAAGDINGSPYHMAQDSIDKTGLGSEDRALSAGAVAGPPTVATQVSMTSVGLGGSLTDKVTLTGSSGTVTGTVQFQLCSGTTTGCPQGTGTNIGSPVALVNGSATSPSFGSNLAPGNYCIGLVYMNDGNSFYSNTYSGSATNECFTVGKGTSTTTTTVFDAKTNAAWTGNEPTGSSAYDTSSVTPSGGVTATGTVMYSFFTNSGCTGTGASAGTVTLTATGAVPNSNTESTLAQGSYSFQATYSGDGNYAGSTSACEPFSVGKGTSTTATTVFDATTNAAWSGTETTGSSAYDTSTVTTSDTITATGTVTYTFFANGTCNGTGASAGTVTLTASGTVPNSNTEKTLAAGSYSFQAIYSGDGNYAGSTSACEPFSVAKGTSTTATTVFDAGTNAAWTGSETTGASAYDTSSVGISDTITATGTVTYTFFANGTCQGTGTSAGTVTLTASGAVPNSNTEKTLAAGSYSFQATYSGDSNYGGSTSGCEPFSVAAGTSTTKTVVFDASTNAPWAGTESTGSSAYDTASVTTSDTLTATGTVTYTFFANGTCQGTGTGAGTVTLTAAGAVPNSTTEKTLAAGSYSFQATYSGDSNYGGSTGACEPFSVGGGTSSTKTVVFDASTNAPWAASETTGASAYDTASVSTSDTLTATGTVTYTFFANGTCQGTGTSAGTVTLTASGAVPNSSSEKTLAAGSYSFQAVYSGDGNYAGSTGQCEPFTVAQGSSTTATTVFDAGTNAVWTGSETTGASAYDTSSVSISDTITATGTVTYTFFTNGSCQGAGASAGKVTLTATGSVPNSSTESTLATGSYSFQAVYSGDSNYAGSTGACEPFSVGKGTSTTATTVFDATSNAPWSATETTGASAYDTSTVTTSDTITATGTVTYTFFANGTCQGTGAGAGTVTLTSTGAVPNSSTEHTLAAGSYSFQAVYSGDSNYGGSTGACEPFSVAAGTSTTKTVVFDASTNQPWAGTESTGASAYDTATVTTSDTITATGTVAYTFFANGTCQGTGTSAGTVTLTATGAAPNSSTEQTLADGSYSFQATYSGDGNYGRSTGACEPFTVGQGTSTTATNVFDASTNAPWAGTETTGSSAYDTATVTTSDTVTATGTVTYTFFANGSCQGSGTTAGTVTLTATGTVPNSSTEHALAVGSYSFQAKYSGDSNYAGSTGQCEPFSVGAGTSTAKTVVFDASTNAPWSGSEPTGSSAYDTATVTTSDTIIATGTVSYTFFTNNSCSGAGASAGTVTLTASGTVPNSSTEHNLAEGSYSFQAVYSGDANYGGSTGACEPFSVGQGPTTTATVVYDASTNAPWAGSETTGASAYDTSTVGGEAGGIVPTGTVAYTFFANNSCSGTGTSAGTFTLTATGAVPNSSTEHTLAAGSYSFQAAYSGDGNYASSTGQCEPFTVRQGSSNTATTVFDASTNAPWAGTESTGSSAYDTATVTTSDSITATGTVTYTFFKNNGCSGTGASAGTVTLTASGAVPNSSTESTLADGSYSFQATYGGDSNYAASTGACEPFTVGGGTSSTKTVVDDASTNAPWAGTETAGASAYDTATVTTSDTITATGTVTYTFFANASCQGTGAGAGTVTLTASGTVPNSNTESALAGGSYSFQATYSGDSNYSGSTGPCEPFTVLAPTTTNTGQTITLSDFAKPTGFGIPTGTVDFQLFSNANCSGTPLYDSGPITLVNGLASTKSASTQPTLTAGTYYWLVSYSGDANNLPSTSPCGTEQTTINNNSPGTGS